VADHPVKVPAELFTEWLSEALLQHDAKSGTVAAMVADRAAQWGADQELMVCMDAIYLHEGRPLCGGTAEWLHSTRRPKPPSLAEQGLEALRSTPCTEQRHYDAMFAALNRLAELEAQQ
jgi:hypothetical protein